MFSKDQEIPTDSISNLGENECSDIVDEHINYDVDESNNLITDIEQADTISCEEQQQNKVIL